MVFFGVVQVAVYSGVALYYGLNGKRGECALMFALCMLILLTLIFGPK